jgi:hypothetical protein
MANLLNRHTLEFIESVDQTEFHARTGTDPADWIRGPDMSQVVGVPRHLWKLVGERPEPMTQAEIDAAATAAAAQEIADSRQTAKLLLRAMTPQERINRAGHRASYLSQVEMRQKINKIIEKLNTLPGGTITPLQTRTWRQVLAAVEAIADNEVDPEA